ncbi:calcium-binding protein [Ruegeria atlantica]|uniref:calcium-binding protein n=1 Tax=Ruegeria atlantica TaxID=81569 RepID=UPI00147E6F48|nr:cadherin-like domain-containing protein [Ruegeria atlantica]
MAKDTIDQGQRFSDSVTSAQLASALVETPDLFRLVIDTEGLAAVNLPDGFVTDRYAIVDGDLFLIGTDGKIVVLLSGAENNYVLQFDGVPIAATALTNAVEALGEWDQLGDIPRLTVAQMMDLGAARPGTGEQEPVNVGDPLIGLVYNPLLPPSDYPSDLQTNRRFFGDVLAGDDDDGVPEPGENDIELTGRPIAFETDAPVSFRPASFIDFNLEQADIGEAVSRVTLQITGLPLGTSTNFGQIVDVGGVATLNFSGSEADFEALVLTFPTDFSTESRNDAPPGPLQATIAIETTFLGSAQLEFPITVFAEGDAVIDDTGPDTVVDESDAPTTFKPSELLDPKVTDIDGSEDYQSLTLIVEGLPAGSTIASLGLVVPVGAEAVVRPTFNGSTTLTITMTADRVSDIQAAYDGLELTLPTDFSTESRTDLGIAGELPLTLTLSIQTDEDVSAATDTPSDGTVTATRIVDIGAEGDLQLSGPGAITIEENDAPGVTDEDNTTTAPLDVRPADAVTGQATDLDGSETIATVDVVINGLPANTSYSTDGGTTFRTAPAGAVFTLNGLTFAQYQDLVIRLPDDFSTTTPLTGSATFTTNEAILAGETDTGPDDGIETGTFTITVNSEQDVEITTNDITVIEDLGTEIPLNVDVDVTDIDGSESITSITLDFANLPAGDTVLSDGTVLNPAGTTQWTGDLATLQSLAVTSLPTHYSGVITITVTVDTDEGDPTVAVESFDLNVTPVAEPTIILSVDDSTANVDERGPDNYLVDEDTSFLLLIDAETPDRDGSEALTQIVIENIPVGWVANAGGVVDPALFEQGAAQIASATISGTTLTITLVANVTDFDGAIRMTPLTNDDRDVETIVGGDLVATVTSLDQAPPLPPDTQTATDSVDVDVDAIVDGLNIDTQDVEKTENVNGRLAIEVDISGVALIDNDGSETISSLALTITVATASDAFDPSDTSQLELRVADPALAGFVTITQTGSTADSVSYTLAPAGGATQAQYTAALESLETVVPQHFSGVLTLDGELSWNETTTGDVEDDLSDNFDTGTFQITQTVNPRAEADLTASVFVLTAAEVAAGSPTSVPASVEDGSVSGAEILTLLESTDDGSGPGQVSLFVGLDAETPDSDGSEELGTLVVANIPTDWIADFLTGTNVDPGAFFSVDGTSPLVPAELAKIDTATYDPATGNLTITFVPDVTSFEGSIQLNPTLYEDYDVDRDNGDPFTSAGDFFGDDLQITLTTQDNNTVTTDDQVSDATFDVDVEPVNNFAVILELPEGNEGEIDAAGGVWQIPFEPIIQDQDGSEQVSAVVLRNVPAGVTIYVPDPANPGGPKILALLTEVNTPPGFNTWSLENGGWTGAEVRGIPRHFAGPTSATVEVVTTESDGGGTRVTQLADQLYIDPVIDGGDPSESYTTAEDTAVFFPIDGNLIDNPTNSPESPEAILDIVIISNIIPDSGGRVPQFFDGPPGDPASIELFPVFAGPSGSLELTVVQASNLWVLPGKDSNEDFVFDVSLEYYETLDPSQNLVATGTATLTVTGVADDPIITSQDETAYTGAIAGEFNPGGTTDTRPNSELIYGYAGFSNAPFFLDSRLRDSVIQNGVTSDQQDETFIADVTPLSGVMTEILVPQGDPAADFDGSETIYYLITGVDPATSFANATPLDASGESYLVTESQLANLQFVPTAVTETTYYNLTFTAIVTEDDADLSNLTGLTIEEIILQIDSLPGGAAVSEEFSIVVVPNPGGGPDPCEPEQELPLPILELVGSGDEDTEIAFRIKITPVPPFYDSIDDLVNLPNGVTGSFGLGLDLPDGATLSSDPPGAILFDPVTGQYAIDLSVLGVDPSDPTQTAGSILFTPPEHESSPASFPADETFGPDDPYDGLNELDYSMILVNATCNTTTSGNSSFAITINPVVDGPEIVVLATNSVLEDTAFTPNIEIRGIDPGERPVGDIIIEIDSTNGGALLDGAGNPIPGTSVPGGKTRYTVTVDQLPTLQITANEHYSGPLDYSVTATSQDLDGSTLSNTITQTLTIIPVADDPFFNFDQTPIDPDTGQPFVDLSGATPVITIIEDVPFTLGSVLDAGSPDQDGSEEVTLVLSGVPDYLIVTGPSSGFINNGDGTYTMSDDAFGQIQFVLRDEHARTPDGLDSSIPDEIPLTLTVNTLETENSDSNSGSVDFIIRVRPDADLPTVTASVTPDTGVEDDATVYTLDISGTTPDPHETMAFEITVPPGGKILLDGVEQPIVGGVVAIPGNPVGTDPSGNVTFDPTGTVTFDPPLDFAGDVTLEVVAITTDTALDGSFSDSESSAPADLDLTIAPSLDLDLSVDPDPDSSAQTGAPIVVELGIDAIVTDTLGIETLDEVAVSFNDPLPAGATVSDGVLSPDRQTLTLTRGALTSAEFTVLVAAVAVLLPGNFAGAVEGSVVATTNHGTSLPVAFSFDVNDLPGVSGPVDITSTDPVFFITNAELLANASDMDALSIANVASDDPTNVSNDVQAAGEQITVPNAYVGTPILTYDVVDGGTPPASAQATANLDIDTLQMEVTGTTITDPAGAPRDLLDDVTGAVGGKDIAKGTAGNDGVVLSGTSPYAEIEGFSLLDGDDFIDLSASNNGYSIDLGADDDWAIGSSGNDVLIGGSGSDILNGGEGSDSLEGGAGSDIFVMTDLTMSDVITDYEGPAGGDQIDLTTLVNIDPGNLGSEVTYDNTNGELDVRGTLVATVNTAGGGFSTEVEVIFNDASGAQQTAVI